MEDFGCSPAGRFRKARSSWVKHKNSMVFGHLKDCLALHHGVKVDLSGLA